MLSFQWLMCLALLALAALYWRHSLYIKERAYRAARKRCQELELQLLDDSVYLRQLRVKRNDRGILALWRAYQFEFTVSGSERYRGHVLMLGRQIEAIELQPHVMH